MLYSVLPDLAETCWILHEINDLEHFWDFQCNDPSANSREQLNKLAVLCIWIFVSTSQTLHVRTSSMAELTQNYTPRPEIDHERSCSASGCCIWIYIYIYIYIYIWSIWIYAYCNILIDILSIEPAGYNLYFSVNQYCLSHDLVCQ